MFTARKLVATVATATVIAAPLSVLGATPAHAADREFGYAGADIDFDVEKDDGRFEIDVDLDDAKPGSRWRIVLRHEGRIFHDRIHRADSDGEIEVDRSRPNTAGTDTFVLSIRKIGVTKNRSSTIRTR